MAEGEQVHPTHPLSLRRVLLAASLLLLVALLAATLWLLRYANSPLTVSQQSEQPFYFTIERGASLRSVASDLAAAGVLSSPRVFVALSRWQGASGSLQVGEYELEAGITPLGLLEKFTSGDTRQYRLTLVEGWTFQQALQEIQSRPGVRQETVGLTREQISQRMDIDRPDPEGMLFPDTYFYTGGTTDLQLLQRANAKLMRVLEEQWAQRLGALPYRSPYEALIMASIIEKESSQQSERGHIAGVFVRRLEQGMRLQSDPTVIYGLGPGFDGNLTRADLRETTPYNTYRINGLPPTPIALAGRESIAASLNPLPSDYLYFVARGDGSHYFSATLEEHNAAVNRFQINQYKQ